MAVATPTRSTALLELRSAALTLIAVVLKTTDLAVLARDLDDRVAATPAIFDRDPVAIDLSRVREATEAIDFAALIVLLRSNSLVPVAARGGNAEQMAAAFAAGLAEAPESPRANLPRAAAAPGPESTPVLLTECIREVQLPAPPAMIVDRPLRSGQQVYARGGDLVVLALVSFGAEVIADGSIHVYAPLRGRAIAGAKGDTQARIFSTCMEPQIVSIAGIYRTTETALPDDVLGKTAQVRLDGERLLVEALER
jgi:septum site-determining protein MinC